MWVQASFDSSSNQNDFIVRGKIDRINILPSTSDIIKLQIIDYKTGEAKSHYFILLFIVSSFVSHSTGKKPWFKYSNKVNERI